MIEDLTEPELVVLIRLILGQSSGAAIASYVVLEDATKILTESGDGLLFQVQ